MNKARFFCRKRTALVRESDPLLNTWIGFLQIVAVRAFLSAPGRFRTCGLRFKGPSLCRLSYGCVPRGGLAPLPLGQAHLNTGKGSFPGKKVANAFISEKFMTIRNWNIVQ